MSISREPVKQNLTVIKIGTDQYHHQSGPKALNPELVARVDAAALVDLIMHERWKGQCEIIPDYMPPYPRPETRPRVVARYKIHSTHPNHEAESYTYLRYSCGPRQGFFWDIYGDDLMSIELALMAIHQAPYPIYTGPSVFRIPLATPPTLEGRAE